MDGCAKHYRCNTVLYLLAMLNHGCNTTIDRAFRAPVNGKYVLDGMNVIGKNYLSTLMTNHNDLYQGFMKIRR